MAIKNMYPNVDKNDIRNGNSAATSEITNVCMEKGTVPVGIDNGATTEIIAHISAAVAIHLLFEFI